MSDIDQKSGRVPPLDPREYVFGFGRRICPGLHLVQASAWTSIVHLLASFNLRLKDTEVELEPEFSYDGIVW